VLTRLGYWWDSLRGSFWFLPAVLTAAAVGLSFGAVAADRAAGEEGTLLSGWTYRAGPDGARGVLSTIAGSMITVAGVVFSITVVALSLASQQFGPRLIRNFTRDRGNQLVLGTFVATFVYCLLVLRTVNGTEKETFVPELGVTVGVGLALASLAVLIYFIHHVAVSIQASHVVERVGAELVSTVDEVYPEEIGSAAPVADPPAEEPPADARPVRAEGTGYVHGVDADAVLRAATEGDLVVYLPLPPGRFVRRGDAVARVVTPSGKLPAEVEDGLRRAVLLGPNRTGYQDIEFALLQLTEIAVRALSPGVNDPFTAAECVDRLGDGLGRLAARAFPSPVRSGPDGRVRVVARRPTFPELLDAALDPVRHHARGSPLVLGRLLAALAGVAERAVRPADREAVRGHVERVVRAAETLPGPDDRDRLLARADAVRTGE
jgi:uncharacterized membrane protein